MIVEVTGHADQYNFPHGKRTLFYLYNKFIDKLDILLLTTDLNFTS